MQTVLSHKTRNLIVISKHVQSHSLQCDVAVMTQQRDEAARVWEVQMFFISVQQTNELSNKLHRLYSYL